MVVHPAPPKSTVTCYAGDNVSFTMDRYGNPEVVCSYGSVRDWQDISPSTRVIYDLAVKRARNAKKMASIIK